MDGLDYVRTGKVKTFVVTSKLFRTILKRPRMVVIFLQSISLDDSAHGTVQNQNPVFGN